jgi:DNA primase
LTEDVRPRSFGMREALERVKRDGDLFAPVLEDPRPLAPAAKALETLAS